MRRCLVLGEKIQSLCRSLLFNARHANVALHGLEVGSPDILSGAIHWIDALLGLHGLEVHPQIFITRVGATPL